MKKILFVSVKITFFLTSMAYYFRDPVARHVEVNLRIWHDQWALFSNTMQEAEMTPEGKSMQPGKCWNEALSESDIQEMKKRATRTKLE